MLREIQDKLQIIKQNPNCNQKSSEETKEGDEGIVDDIDPNSSDKTSDDDTQENDEGRNNTDEQYQHLRDVIVESEQDDLPLDLALQKELQFELACEFRKPLILHGISGSGKTALMAKICDLSEKWLGEKIVRVIRFLGTSPQSYNIKETLISVIEQIWSNYEISPPSDMDLGADFSYLILYFQALLHKVNTSNKPLLILLDSIDQLNSENYAHSLQWLPRFLPPGVYMIISFITDFQSCLEIAKNRIVDEDR